MAAVRTVSAAEAAQMLKDNQAEAYLDVRTPEEFSEGRVPGAVNVPLMLRGSAGMVPNPGFVEGVRNAFPNAAEALIVGCKAGGRSTKACDVLQQEYENLVNVNGGFDAWSAAGLPVEK